MTEHFSDMKPTYTNVKGNDCCK